MATNAKRENPKHQHPENSELEVMRAKVRKLEATVKELQVIKEDQVDHHEAHDVVDILLVFMNNIGFKRIADKIMSFLDCESFVQCRLVCRSWKNFIDNEWSMLQLQIFHLKRHPNEINEYGEPHQILLNEHWLNFGALIKIMEKTTNKSKSRVFIKMCQELVSKRCHYLNDDILQYMIAHHRHQELEMLLDYPVQRDQNNLYYGGHFCFTPTFKYACQYGCKICVKLLLDLTEGKEIDFNQVKPWNEKYYKEYHEYEHCLFVAKMNIEGHRKEVMDLLLCRAEEKGIDVNAKTVHYGTSLRDQIIDDFEDFSIEEIEEYSEATYKILKIDPSVDLKRKCDMLESWLFK